MCPMLGILCHEYEMDTMRWHTSFCEALTTKDKVLEEEEESESNNGNGDDGYLLEGV